MIPAIVESGPYLSHSPTATQLVGVALRLNTGSLTPESEFLTALGNLGGGKEARLGWAGLGLAG